MPAWGRALWRVALLAGVLAFGSVGSEALAQPQPPLKTRAKPLAQSKTKSKAKTRLQAKTKAKASAKAKTRRTRQRELLQEPPPVIDAPDESPSLSEDGHSTGLTDSHEPALSPEVNSSGDSDGSASRGEPAQSPGQASGGESVGTASSGEPALPPGLGTLGESAGTASGSAPALPPGLDSTGEPHGLASSGEPPLPSGLDGLSGGGLPAGGGGPLLPPGLDGSGDSGGSASRGEESSLLERLGLSGFVDLRNGVRVQDDPYQAWATLAEVRLQVSMEQVFFDRLGLKLTGDFLLDSIAEDDEIDLERGRGPIDLREASLSYTPLDFLDIKIGRQTLTWGTADFVFLNDLFPKDFQAFFLGRDMRYLKASSDAVKVGVFTPVGNLDVIFVPRFNPDRFITGERLSYYNPQMLQLAGQNAIIEAAPPDDWVDDSELHARYSLNLGSVELAAYGYRGYWKSPGGFDATTGMATFPRLNVFGGSLRDKLFSGITHLEVAYYHSLEDRAGDNAFVNNSEARFLIGYERQFPGLSEDLTLWAQYYLELIPHYDAYLGTLPEGFPAREELRHLVTLRITQLLFGQNMTASLLAVYSPSDRDGYLRPSLGYKVADCCSVTVGGNFFFGSEDYTFLNQLQNNANAYAALQYGF